MKALVVDCLPCGFTFVVGEDEGDEDEGDEDEGERLVSCSKSKSARRRSDKGKSWVSVEKRACNGLLSIVEDRRSCRISYYL